VTRIIGIDPGSRTTGYGVIDHSGVRTCYVDCGCIDALGETMSKRLRSIFEGVQEVIDRHRPEQMAIEQVFMHRNAASALKLGQARSAAMLAAELRLVDVNEYTPAQIKQAVTGRGRGSKEQVQHMVRILLALAGTPAADAADALAVALCHAHTSGTRVRIEAARRAAT
jgi:crossover junction endodeoxyribonuclease RuvC